MTTKAGLAPDHTFTEFVHISNDTIAYDIDLAKCTLELGDCINNRGIKP